MVRRIIAAHFRPFSGRIEVIRLIKGAFFQAPRASYEWQASQISTRPGV